MTSVTRAGVAAGHRTTAEAGAEILERGGNAVDAAVAMMLVSCAAETIFTGLGGGGFATVYDAVTGQVRCVDFFVSVPGLGGKRPGPGTEIEVIFVGQRMPYEIGAGTVAVPGIPAGAAHLWRRWGRLPWAEVVEPGLQASYGTPFPEMHARLLPRVAAAMVVGAGVDVYRRADGQYLQPGDPLRHADHHKAYELLMTDPGAFYTGEFAACPARLGRRRRSGEPGGPGRVPGGRDGAADRSRWTGTPCTRAGDDLDDVLPTMAAAARSVPGDPRTDPTSARGLV